MGKPDPNAVILEKLDSIRDEIMGRLDRIEEEPKILKNDILNQITLTIYIISFGGKLKLKNQIEGLVSNLNTTINSKSYSNKEKIVESTFLIGNNVKWIDKGNIIFKLNNIAFILSGNTYALTDREISIKLYMIHL